MLIFLVWSVINYYQLIAGFLFLRKPPHATPLNSSRDAINEWLTQYMQGVPPPTVSPAQTGGSLSLNIVSFIN